MPITQFKWKKVGRYSMYDMILYMKAPCAEGRTEYDFTNTCALALLSFPWKGHL